MEIRTLDYYHFYEFSVRKFKLISHIPVVLQFMCRFIPVISNVLPFLTFLLSFKSILSCFLSVVLLFSYCLDFCRFFTNVFIKIFYFIFSNFMCFSIFRHNIDFINNMNAQYEFPFVSILEFQFQLIFQPCNFFLKDQPS